MERTLVLLKPDAVQRGLVGELISRFERKGLKIVGMKFLQVTDETARKHYFLHEEKPFFPRLVDFLTSSPVVAIVLEGEQAISLVRKMAGSSGVGRSELGTIRFDYSASTNYNLVHTSDSEESATYEIGLYFEPTEIVRYSRVTDTWLYGEVR